MNLATPLRILHSIIQNVKNRFFRPFTVMNEPQSVRTLYIKCDLFPRSRRNNFFNRLPDCSAQIRSFHLHLNQPRLQPGHFHHALEKKFQLIRLLVQTVQEFFLTVRLRLFPQKGKICLYIRKRGSRLMGNIGNQAFQFFPACPVFFLFLLPDPSNLVHSDTAFSKQGIFHFFCRIRLSPRQKRIHISFQLSFKSQYILF